MVDAVSSDRGKRRLTFVLGGVSAAAIAVTAVTLVAVPEKHRTVSLPAPPTTTTTQPPPPPVVVRTPEVVFPTTIPGCDSVERGEGHRLRIGAGSVNPSYDNPHFPWFTGRKAVAMSDVLRAAIPRNVELEFASPSSSLLFQPIIGDEEFGGSTTAIGNLIRGKSRGDIIASVSASDAPPPPCIAGALDRRTKLADGTVFDSDDTWVEYDGVRSLRRTVSAYRTDGTQVSLSVTDSIQGEKDPKKRQSGRLPLTVSELSKLAVLPGLGVDFPIPAGTPEPPPSCGSGFDEGPTIDRAMADKLNRALESGWRNAKISANLDRSIASLEPSTFGPSQVCESLTASRDGTVGNLTISISGGHELPAPKTDRGDPYERDLTRSTLAGGAVLDTATRIVATTHDGESERETSTSVTVTYPGGTQIHVTLRSKTDPSEQQPLSSEELKALATAPGLELPK